MTDSKNRTKELYTLPHASSVEEGGRLDGQHNMLKILLDGLFPCPELVAKVMMDEEGRAKSVLDLGSGSGAWCMDVANQFPQAQVVGIDIAPNLQRDTSNCRFELWDINQGLSPFHGQFDLVHVRFIHGIVNHHNLTLEAIKCLKPGGLIIFLRVGPIVTDDRTTLMPAASSRMPDQSWYQRFWSFVELGSTQRGLPAEIYNHDYDEGFWDHDTMDAKTCGAAFITIPLGAWVTTSDPAETARLRTIGKFWAENAMRIHRHLDHVMSSAGRSEKDIELLHTHLDNELQTTRIRSSMIIRAIWGCSQSVEDANSRNHSPPRDEDAPLPLLSNEPGEYRVITIFDNKPTWTKFNAQLMSTMTPDTKKLRGIPGFDPIEA
ncbi:hypothetical protein M408DRAFT_21035 [Serendipita vermifera MAFF 305830]|uniref:Methyltransferase domain-containing protein n=1 Tax=Serendipita vermifera MAFF 305830 TaxID=933852 RepID=A0A0C2XSA8_SERVB|nr:hypothetical protein M408DRAFT_21035 [Serendipita vermifera MAFF 305830]